MVLSHNSTLCLHPEYFPEPNKFLPERWLRNKSGDLVNDIHPFSLLPFGHGPRMCIGRRFAEQEIYLGLIKVGNSSDELIT